MIVSLSNDVSESHRREPLVERPRFCRTPQSPEQLGMLVHFCRPFVDVQRHLRKAHRPGVARALRIAVLGTRSAQQAVGGSEAVAITDRIAALLDPRGR